MRWDDFAIGTRDGVRFACRVPTFDAILTALSHVERYNIGDA
jgi:hypothetical protein